MTATKSQEIEIRRLIEEWARAVRSREIDAVVAAPR